MGLRIDGLHGFHGFCGTKRDTAFAGGQLDGVPQRDDALSLSFCFDECAGPFFDGPFDTGSRMFFWLRPNLQRRARNLFVPRLV